MQWRVLVIPALGRQSICGSKASQLSQICKDQAREQHLRNKFSDLYTQVMLEPTHAHKVIMK